MEHQRIAVQVNGTAAILMHNVRLANPLDEYAIRIKEITSKTKKTEADYLEIYRWEWMGGLYYNAKLGPCVPSRVIRGTIITGGEMIRSGKKVEQGVLIQETQAKLVYEGIRDRDLMYQSGQYTDIRTVSGQGKRGGSKTMRCRPIFEAPWSVAFTLMVDTARISPADLRQCVEKAGAYHGLFDGRSEGYGRFEIAEWFVG